MIYAKVGRNIFLCFLCLLLCIPSPAYAEVEEFIDKFAANNIMFYNPDDDNCNDTHSTKPTGDQITWIGDSYTEGAKSKIEAKLPGVDLDGVGDHKNYQSSKRMGYDITGNTAVLSHGDLNSDNPSGLTILKNLVDEKKLREYVVFALGTNDQGISSETISGFIDDFYNIADDDTKVILMNPRTYDGKYQSVIDGIKDAQEKHKNVYIADWAAKVEEDLDKYFTPSTDKTHPNGAGYTLFVDTIYDALPGGSVGVLPGNSNVEKAWNYFATVNIAGVSDNAAVIAGILGNLQQESSFSPFGFDGTHYGIYQTDDTALKNEVDAAGYGSYWGKSSAPDDAVSNAMKIELDFLTQKNKRFIGTGWASGFGFMKNINAVDNTPEGYSDLFVMAVEGAATKNTVSEYTGKSNYIKDAAVRALGAKYFSTADGGGQYYQEAENRREYARKIYDKYAGSSQTSKRTSQTTDTSSYKWENGWLISGVPGIEKQDVTKKDLDETLKSKFTTSDGKPDKIILHSTEGTSNGFDAYPVGNKYPAHFIVDLTKREGYQNLPISAPALSTKTSDGSTIQIEIVGFSAKKESKYYLQKFSDDDWDYLAVLLAAIASETNIPLTTDVDWDTNKNIRVSSQDAFAKLKGIVGHMHSPSPDDHTDPGNIWSFVEAAIARNPSASKFGKGYDPCLDDKGSGLKSGGMTLAEGKEFMKAYRDIQPRNYPSDQLTKWKVNNTSGCTSDLENCTALSTWFIHEYTTADTGYPPDGKGVVSFLLDSNQGFIDGGHTPKPYAIFSRQSGGQGHGHTGVVLGVDKENGKVITAEAGCYSSFDFSTAHEHDLSEFTSNDYTYAYTDDILKEGL